MGKALSMKQLRCAGKAKRRALLEAVVEAACSAPNDELRTFELEISQYERRYEVPSARLVAELDQGSMKETAEVARWLMLLKLRERLTAAQA
jgi:hypothetical protein